MASKFHFTFVPDWRTAPGAFWVHRPTNGKPDDPPAPLAVPHKGFPLLHVEFEKHELLFSSIAQLEHYIEVLSQKALPTSRQLSEASSLKTGPNQHWLSRLPGDLKSPKRRQSLVKVLLAAKAWLADNAPNQAFQPMPEARLN
jgi:hypothetical protein